MRALAVPTDAEGVRESLAAAAAVIDVMRLDTSAPDYGLTAETTDYGPTALTHEFFCNPSCDFDKPFFAEKNGRSCMQTVWKEISKMSERSGNRARRRPWVGADATGGSCAQRNDTQPHDSAGFHVRACKCARVGA